MLSPFHEKIDAVGFIHAHTGARGPDGAGNTIYAAAARRIGPDGSREGFESLLRYGRFSGPDRYRSGLSREVLEKAPEPRAVASGLRRFASGQDHWFLFDEGGAAEALRSILPGARFVDLGFAAEYFLPHLDAHAPKRLQEYLTGRSRDKVSFTAGEMVDLAVELVRHICGEILNDTRYPWAPALRWHLKRGATLFGRIFPHLCRRYTDYFGGLFAPHTRKDARTWHRYLEEADFPHREGDGAGAPPPAREAVSETALADLYRAVSHGGKGYAFRAEQLSFARHVAGAFNDRAVLTIEAGTGTGKTQGYLVPVLAFLRANPRARAVISTYTKNLQEQIHGRELVFIRQVLDPLFRDIPVALLKGKSSHICARKLDALHEEEMDGRPLLAWTYFLNLVFNFRVADPDGAGGRVKAALDPHFRRMREEISARSGCRPSHTRCPAQVMTAEACRSRLVITNHHKLALLDGDPHLADLFRYAVVDEANHFEHAVRNAFAVSVGSREVADLTGYLSDRLARLSGRAAAGGEIGAVLARIDRLNTAMSVFKGVLGAAAPKGASGTVVSLPPDHPRVADGEIPEEMHRITGAMGKALNSLAWIRDPDTCRRLKIPARTLQRMRSAAATLEEHRGALSLIREGLAEPNRITAFQTFRRHWIMTSQALDVADLIDANFHRKKESIVYTAATLCHRGRFDSFRRIAGMNGDRGEGEERDFRFAIIPSPFSPDAMEVVVPPEAVSGKYGNKSQWVDVVVRMVPELIHKNRGRTLVLFASYSDLEQVAGAVADALDDRYPLLIQRRGMPTVTLCDEFRTVKESVLFGVDTFWYGVDFRGETLTQVIITRIPYPSPSEPIQMARKRSLPPADYWERYQYETDIKIKQGIGRLIRCHTDRGRVVILDSRFRWG